MFIKSEEQIFVFRIYTRTLIWQNFFPSLEICVRAASIVNLHVYGQVWRQLNGMEFSSKKFAGRIHLKSNEIETKCRARVTVQWY